ncbi:hypothetical protein [Clostridium butyricum]|uniref:hypothetical protein n=1 Tax=Clostridium butyricum TaxID=1492 RepID=UPI0021027D31|nr:hypothetical protein [Clostridium butyricum]MCQ2013822.1 hypothetical protein [Clostridium butyricum]MCQ2024798.1 hypothetical protein [Clostridium butyricum]
MGDFKEINDQIYDDLIDRLSEEGYDDISASANNKIVDLIDAQYEDPDLFEELVQKAINIIESENDDE